MRKVLFILVGSLGLLASVDAVTLQFEGSAPVSGLLPVTPTAIYSEAGYLVTPVNTQSAVFDSGHTTKMAGITTDFLGFGETNTLTLTRSDLLVFELISLDVGRSSIATASSVTITLTGTVNGGGSLNATFSNLTTATNAVLNWSNLNSVVISTTDDGAIDNVVAAVPEPSSLVLLCGGLAWCGFRRGK